MGDEDRVICQNCSTSYDKKFLLGKQGNVDTCPMCGAGLKSENSIDDSDLDESPGFAEDVVLENENFENPDLYFYDIDEKGEIEDNLRDVWCQCTSCKKVNTISYGSFDCISKEFLKLKKGLSLKCDGCGKLIINIIVPKRPDGWNIWDKEYESIPHCPVCNSTNIKKISMTNKAASAFAFGLFAAGHVSKTYKCNVCGSKF